MRDLADIAWACHVLVSRRGGDRVQPFAGCARDPYTGRLLPLDGTRCPWEDEANALVVGFPAHRLLEAFRIWGWEEPAFVIDLYAEHRVVTNSFSDRTADPDVQEALSAWPTGVRYDDETACDPLLSERHCKAVAKGLTHLLRTLEVDSGAALRRGRYAIAAAAMQDHGFPISEEFRDQAAKLYELLIAEEPDQLSQSLKDSISELGRLADFPVSDDGRSRYELRPYAAVTGRNQPKKKHHAWDGGRCLISPKPGRALAVIDYTAQEFGIAATLSKDPAMIADYYAGDAYRSFGQRVEVADRSLLKRVFLPLMYGQPAVGISKDVGIPLALAQRFESTHRQAYRMYWQWTEDAKRFFQTTGRLHSVFGWLLHAKPDTACPMKKRRRTVANFPVQANGTEILWEACRRLHQEGIYLCGVNHDAVMIEAYSGDLADAVVLAESIMADASAEVLGRPLRTDTEIVGLGGRLAKGQRDWDRLQAAVGTLEAFAW